MCQETETAAGWFEKAVERARPYTDPVPASSMMKPLQASSQWPALAKMMNLPQTFG